MNIQPVVLVNRAGIGNIEALHAWCEAEKLPILAEIPDDRNIAKLYSKGLIPTEHIDSLRAKQNAIGGAVLGLNIGDAVKLKRRIGPGEGQRWL